MFDILKWAEGMWMLKDSNDGLRIRGLGEAGNRHYCDEDQIFAVRIGNEVLVSGTEGDIIIDANVRIKGFILEHLGDGRPLYAVMEEDVIYNYALLPDE